MPGPCAEAIWIATACPRTKQRNRVRSACATAPGRLSGPAGAGGMTRTGGPPPANPRRCRPRICIRRHIEPNNGMWPGFRGCADAAPTLPRVGACPPVGPTLLSGDVMRSTPITAPRRVAGTGTSSLPISPDGEGLGVYAMPLQPIDSSCRPSWPRLLRLSTRPPCRTALRSGEFSAVLRTRVEAASGESGRSHTGTDCCRQVRLFGDTLSQSVPVSRRKELARRGLSL